MKTKQLLFAATFLLFAEMTGAQNYQVPVSEKDEKMMGTK